MREEVARSYLNPNQLDWDRISRLLAVQGVQIRGTSEGEPHLEWSTQEQDFAVFDQLLEFLGQTSEVGDKDFIERELPYVRALALHSPWFNRLNDDTIPRSQAHLLNPFDHSLEVLRQLQTEGLEPFNRFVLRVMAVMHDLGKVCIAYQDVFQDHAKISQLMFAQFLRENYGLDSATVQTLSVLISNHHILELISRDVLAKDQAYSLFPDSYSFALLGIFTLADASSVEEYLPYAYSGGALFLDTVVEQITHLEQEILAILEPYINALIQLAEYLGTELDQKLQHHLEVLGVA